MKLRPPSSTRRLWIFPRAIGIMIFLLFSGCASTQPSAGKKLDAENLTLTYIDKAQAGAEIGEMIMQHPLRISERQMVFHLAALKYENFSLLGKPGPVFTKEDIKNINRLLTKALHHANPQNIIGFEVKSEDGVTQGQLFASKGKLHWRFSKIRGIKHSLTRNQMTRYGTAWRLVPGKGQKFQVTEQFMGSKQWNNWIAADINLPAPGNLKSSRPKKKGTRAGKSHSVKKTPSPSPDNSKSKTSKKDPAELEEKLRFLKYLYENQLIDKEEYEKKRKELLDQYL